MVGKSVILAVIGLLGTGMFAKSACTSEELQAKHQAFIEVALLLAQKNPEQYAEVAQAMQAELPELQKLNDIEGLCRFFDEWLEKMR